MGTCWSCGLRIKTSHKKKKIDKTVSITNSSIKSNDDLSIKHFKLDKSRILGIGGFGLVCQSIKRTDFDKEISYALKIMSKYDVLQRNNGVHAIMNELKALILLVDEVFVCSVHYAFQDERCIYLVLDLAKFGDLRMNLKISQNNRFTEERARFYVCQILLALDSCHKKNILHRDVKPENILLTESGYVKLSDFGVAKILTNIEECYSTSGTHGYMGPEVYIDNHRHGPCADYFALGITLHEMICGRRPFESNRLQSFRLNNNDSLRPVFVETTNYVSESCKAFIVALLNPKATRRLGATHGFEEIIRHKWIGRNIDWELLRWGLLPAPYIPDIRQFKNGNNNEIGKDLLIKFQNSQCPIDNDQKKFAEYFYNKSQTPIVYNDINDNKCMNSSINNLRVGIYNQPQRKIKSLGLGGSFNIEEKSDFHSSSAGNSSEEVKNMKYHQLSSSSIVLSSSEMDDYIVPSENINRKKVILL